MGIDQCLDRFDFEQDDSVYDHVCLIFADYPAMIINQYFLLSCGHQFNFL